jgi:hypothetical protein
MSIRTRANTTSGQALNSLASQSAHLPNSYTLANSLSGSERLTPGMLGNAPGKVLYSGSDGRTFHRDSLVVGAGVNFFHTTTIESLRDLSEEMRATSRWRMPARTAERQGSDSYLEIASPTARHGTPAAGTLGGTGGSIGIFYGWIVLVIYCWAFLLYLYLLLFVC